MRQAYQLFVILVVAIVSSGQSASLERSKIRIHKGDIISFEGDSLTYGLDLTPATGSRLGINGSNIPRSKLPFPELVQDLLHNLVVVQNRGYPGDRSIDGLKRWANAPAAAVSFIMYGTNDFANFGQNPGGRVDVDAFKNCLRELVKRRLNNPSAQVVLMTPPPLEDRSSDLSLNVYRQAVRDVANERQLRIVESESIIGGVDRKWLDGLHLSSLSNRAFAENISSFIEVEDQ
jgi:lysophospholipase L1-like esterase